MTNFNQFIETRIFPILRNHSLAIADQYENYVRFESKKIIVSICHNERSAENMLELGIANVFAYLLTDLAMKEVFHSDLKVDQMPMDVFLENVSKFLADNGDIIFAKDLRALNQFNAFSEQRNRLYNLEMQTRSYLADADKAWVQKDYIAFIDTLKKIDKSILKESYKMKYKIALKKQT